MTKKLNTYQAIIQHIFKNHYRTGIDDFTFTREEIAEAADTLEISTPKNLGDVIYTFRYRRPLPTAFLKRNQKGCTG